VRVALYDSAGRLVRVILDEPREAAGRHEMMVEARDGNGRPLASGVYYYRLDSVGGSKVGRITVLK
jgi:hypothetical protein